MDEEKSKRISRRLSWALMGLGALLVLLLVFHMGFVLGTQQGPGMRGQMGMMRGDVPPPGIGFGEWKVSMPRGFIQQGHGAVGIIKTVQESSIELQTRDGEIKTIFITPQTRIEGQLHVGDQVVTLGEPGTTTENRLTAIFIRTLPPGDQVE
jgi:hypothetical protein